MKRKTPAKWMRPDSNFDWRSLAAVWAVSDDIFRPNIHRVNVEKDGTVVATNGHLAVIMEPYRSGTAMFTKSFTMHATFVKEALRLARSKAGQSGGVKIERTGQDKRLKLSMGPEADVVEYEAHNEDWANTSDKFPDVRKVWVKEKDRMPHAEVCVDAKLIMQAARFIASVSNSPTDGLKPMRLKVYFDLGEHDVMEDMSFDKLNGTARVVLEGTDIECDKGTRRARVLVMPMRV